MASPTSSSTLLPPPPPLPRKRPPSPSPSPPSPTLHSGTAAAAAADEHGHAPADRVEIKRRLVRAKKLRRPALDHDGSDDDNDDGPRAQAQAQLSGPSPSPSTGAALGSGRPAAPHEQAPSSSLPQNAQAHALAHAHAQGQDHDHTNPTTASAPPAPAAPQQTISAPPSPPPPQTVALLAQGGFPRSEYAPSRGKHPGLHGCRSVYNYTRLNHIEEGTYGVVFRARCNDTNAVYALKKLKLDDEKHGFPITSLREIMALMTAGDHEHVVGVREVVVGDTLNQIFIVMPFIEHDLKTLLADMPHPFVQSEVKTIMLQLLSAVEYCHSNWILHRDLKTSNLLMNNRGQLKVADFGLARRFGDPLGDMTQLVVTLWYRAPELLLGARTYTTAVDMWSVGCIFAELLQKEPLFPGRGEIDQLNRILTLLGRPSEDAWPGWTRLPNARAININAVGPGFSQLRHKFRHLSSEGHSLLAALLSYDPARRIAAAPAAAHPYFAEQPLPKHPDLFPSFPSVASGERRHRLLHSPPAPVHEDVDSEKLPPVDLESFV